MVHFFIRICCEDFTDNLPLSSGKERNLYRGWLVVFIYYRKLWIDCSFAGYIEVPYVYIYILYMRKYWQSLNLAISVRSGCILILAENKFGGCTARTKHSK